MVESNYPFVPAYTVFIIMVAAAFPVAKLGAIVVKQLSKPIANYTKTKAKESLFFRTYICMPPAQRKFE